MKTPEKNSRNFFIACLLSQIVWLISTVILLLLFSAIAYSTADPNSITRPLSVCALYLSSAAGGAAAVKLSGDGIASGCLSGCITAFIVFILSFLPFPDSEIGMPWSVVLILLIIPSSIIGAFIGHKKEKKPKKRPHNRM